MHTFLECRTGACQVRPASPEWRGRAVDLGRYEASCTHSTYGHVCSIYVVVVGLERQSCLLHWGLLYFIFFVYYYYYCLFHWFYYFLGYVFPPSCTTAPSTLADGRFRVFMCSCGDWIQVIKHNFTPGFIANLSILSYDALTFQHVYAALSIHVCFLYVLANKTLTWGVCYLVELLVHLEPLEQNMCGECAWPRACFS